MKRELINFIDLTKLEQKLVLSWRNTTNIRRWMYNTNIISFNEHIKFIETLKSTNNRIYFLIKENNIYIGVIDFTNIDYKNETCEIGLYTNPYLFGMGKVLLQEAINYGFKVLKLKQLNICAYKGNKKAINLYEKFGFIPNKTKIDNFEDINCFSIVNLSNSGC